MYSNIGVLTSFLFEYFILVGRGGEGYNLSSCSQIMSGVVDVGNDNLSIGSCLVQKPGNRSSNLYGGDVDHERLHRGFVMTDSRRLAGETRRLS